MVIKLGDEDTLTSNSLKCPGSLAPPAVKAPVRALNLAVKVFGAGPAAAEVDAARDGSRYARDGSIPAAMAAACIAA